MGEDGRSAFTNCGNGKTRLKFKKIGHNCYVWSVFAVILAENHREQCSRDSKGICTLGY
jgi:hypothetical protein